MKKSKKQLDREADFIRKLMLDSYDEYLSESENKETSDVREDAFFNGWLRGIQVATRAKELVKEVGYENR